MKKISLLLVILTCIFLCACNVISNSSDDSKETDTQEITTYNETESITEDNTFDESVTTDSAETEDLTTKESSETTEIYENNWDGMKNADGYGYAVSFVGWASGFNIFDLSEFFDTPYPIFKIDTREELEQFKSTSSNIFDFSRKYEEVLSFEDTMEKTKWNTEAFYKEHSLLVICVKSGSGSFRYGVKEIVTDDDSMSIDVDIVNNPFVATDDMVGWLVLIEITDEQAEKYTTFNVN